MKQLKKDIKDLGYKLKRFSKEICLDMYVYENQKGELLEIRLFEYGFSGVRKSNAEYIALLLDVREMKAISDFIERRG